MSGLHGVGYMRRVCYQTGKPEQIQNSSVQPSSGYERSNRKNVPISRMILMILRIRIYIRGRKDKGIRKNQIGEKEQKRE